MNRVVTSKLINDLHGHETGDAVLQVVAQRLAAAVRGDDLVARFGGDEFVVVFAQGLPTGGLCDQRNRILRALHAPINVPNGTTLSVRASLGLATGEPREVMAAADTALYRAKQSKRAAAIRWSSRELDAPGPREDAVDVGTRLCGDGGTTDRLGRGGQQIRTTIRWTDREIAARGRG